MLCITESSIFFVLVSSQAGVDNAAATELMKQQRQS